MQIILILSHVLFFLALSPLISGLISKLKNNFRMRCGQSIWQPYFNLAKLCNKGQVVPQASSWIFTIAPYILLASAAGAALFIPVFLLPAPLNGAGDLLAIIFIFALGRFFLALAALDTASAFGGMGASREVFISSLVEPALCLAIFSIFLQFGSTSVFAFSGAHPVSVASILAGAALFLAVLAETSRIPVDNQETHLELTMVHEAMVLEYSGRPLALIEMAAYIKQMVWFFIIAQLIFPIAPFTGNSLAQAIIWLLWYLTRIFLIIIAVSSVEVLLAKMRLFRVADFLGFIFVLGLIASVCAILGV